MTLVSERGSILSGKGMSGRKTALQENINPNLNVSTAAALVSLMNANKANEEKPGEAWVTLGGFDIFIDSNAFKVEPWACTCHTYTSFPRIAHINLDTTCVSGKMGQQQTQQRRA